MQKMNGSTKVAVFVRRAGIVAFIGVSRKEPPEIPNKEITKYGVQTVTQTAANRIPISVTATSTSV